MTIYTRTGDDGTTGLFGGQRVPKSHLRIACCGAIDELNAAIGLALAALSGGLAEQIRRVQPELFVIGSHIAAPGGSSARSHLPVLGASIVQQLEQEIDAAERQLRPLRHFILPGGCEAGARLHLARTICRRAERLLVELNQHEALPALILPYVNRLGDWLFVMARRANHIAGVEDVIWKP